MQYLWRSFLVWDFVEGRPKWRLPPFHRSTIIIYVKWTFGRKCGCPWTFRTCRWRKFFEGSSWRCRGFGSRRFRAGKEGGLGFLLVFLSRGGRTLSRGDEGRVTRWGRWSFLYTACQASSVWSVKSWISGTICLETLEAFPIMFSFSWQKFVWLML